MQGVFSRVAALPRGLEALLARIPQSWWSATIVLSYTSVVTLVSLRHVLWRDEAQMWLIGRASRSWVELIANLEYENRPLLWFLLLWPIARLFGNPELIKVVTVLAAATSAFIVTRLVPLLRLEQLALLSGFLFLVGYSTTNTGYMVGVLCLLLWYQAYVGKSPIKQFLFLSLASATHVLFLLVAVPLAVLCFTVWLTGTIASKESIRPQVLVAILLSALVIGYSAWLVPPPEDYGFVVAAKVTLAETLPRFAEYVGAAIRAPGIALPVLLTRLPVFVWALPVVLVVVVAVIRGRWIAAAPVASLTLVTASGVFGYGVYWWHSGLVVVSLLLVVLLTRSSSIRSPFSGLMLLQTVAFWFVLGVQIIVLLSVPGRYLWTGPPYSGAKEAAFSVQTSCPDGCPLVTNDAYLVTAVSAYLSGEPIYSVATGRNSTFTVWDKSQAHGRSVSWKQIRQALLDRGPGSLAILTNMSDPPPDFVVVSEPSASVWPDERFLVVRLKYGS